MVLYYWKGRFFYLKENNDNLLHKRKMNGTNHWFPPD